MGGKGGRCVELTTLPPSCADCLDILGASNSCNPQGLSRDCFTFALPLPHALITYCLIEPRDCIFLPFFVDKGPAADATDAPQP
jgi:hypothetical protein